MARIIAPLTTENAESVLMIVNRTNPQWGVKRFNYKEQELLNGKFTHTFGVGSNSAILSESEFESWGVVSFKERRKNGE